MRVLVLGSGAKDHAMTWWLSKSCFISGLFVAKGNYCTPDIAGKLENVGKKMENLRLFLEEGIALKGWNVYKEINLKFENQIVCVKR